MTLRAGGHIRVTLVVGFWIFAGNSGVISFGHAAFACLGAYTSAWLTLQPTMKTLLLPGLPGFLAQAHWPVLPAALAAGLLAAALALISGAPVDGQTIPVKQVLRESSRRR